MTTTQGTSRTERRARGRRLAAVGLALALVAAGCGDDGDDQGSDTTTTSPGPTTTTVPPGLVVPDHPRVVAHRGASADAPENTIAAFALGVEQGADFVELDVQLTADGELVVLHDEVLDRTARGPAEDCTGPIDTRTLVQVQGCDAGTWFNEEHPDRADPSFADERISSLVDVLRAGGDETSWYIETKTLLASDGTMEEALAAVLEATGFTVGSAAAGRVLVQSFDAGSVERMRALRPDLTYALLLGAGAAVDDAALDAAAAIADGIGPDDALVDAELVAAAHERCLTVVPYTVDEPADMTRLLDLGVDGLISNVPDVLVPLVEGRRWSPPCT